jgi:hypothetical protein
MPRRILAALVILPIIVAPWPGWAMPQAPLPTFYLSAADGTRVSSVELLGQQQWIVIYAAPGCRACDGLLASLGRVRTEGLLRRTLLVIGAPPEDARAYVRQTLPRELRGLRWYADDQAEAWGALQLAGAPMLVGIRDGRVEWGISGALSDPAKLRGLVRSWLGE